MRFQPTKFSIGGSYGGSYGSSYAQQTYGSSYSQPYSSGTRSFFDMTDLLNQFKTKFTAGYLKSFGVSEPEIKQITQPETKKIYDSTVMQNYGIVCPTRIDQDDEVKLFDCPMANYGIVISPSKDTKINPDITKDSDPVKIFDCPMANYGIVISPSKETSKSNFDLDSSAVHIKKSDGLISCIKFLNS